MMKHIMLTADAAMRVNKNKKSAIRRVIMDYTIMDGGYVLVPGGDHASGARFQAVGGGAELVVEPPFFPGEIVFIKEPWQYAHEGIIYKSDKDIPDSAASLNDKAQLYDGWRLASTMPGPAFARTFLRIRSCHVERLQDIDGVGAYREGWHDNEGYITRIPTVLPEQAKKMISDFAQDWDANHALASAIYEEGENGPQVSAYIACPWESRYEFHTMMGVPYRVCGNPYVWVVEFDKVSTPEDTEIRRRLREHMEVRL